MLLKRAANSHPEARSRFLDKNQAEVTKTSKDNATKAHGGVAGTAPGRTVNFPNSPSNSLFGPAVK